MKLPDYIKHLPRGTRTCFANKCGVTTGTLWQWQCGAEVPSKHLMQIWEATDKKVHPRDVRPDLYPPDLIAELKDGIRNV